MNRSDMIAPCGLDCSLCRHAITDEKHCRGCNGPDEDKIEFCRTGCGIVLCSKRRENGYRFCDECPDYPCEDVMEKEIRYSSGYPHRESPLTNIRMIREMGMEAFLSLEDSRWSCPSCGRLYSVHLKDCPHCGTEIHRDDDPA